jgi:hypothetical protein
MDDSKDSNLFFSDSEDDLPAKANGFSVHPGFGWNFFTFSKSQRIIPNLFYFFKNTVTNLNCALGFMLDKSDVAGDLVKVFQGKRSYSE